MSSPMSSQNQLDMCRKIEAHRKVTASPPMAHNRIDDDDDDTQKKSVQQSLEAWPYRRECRGRNPTKKSVTTEVACSVGKFCTYTPLMTVCSTSNMEKTKDERNTGCC